MEKEKKNTVIAFAGKGGVGKTSISAMTVRLLAERYPGKRILAIDADPAVGLATALGVEVFSTVDEIRSEFVEAAKEGNAAAAVEMLGEAKYRLMDALVDRRNISFLAIGRPEAAGCYCSVNAYLKEVIRLMADHFDYVVIDGEAGIEQVNRRVMEKISHLVLVSDASRKGLAVAQTIEEVAGKLTMCERSALVVNRLADPELKDRIDTGALPCPVFIGDDREMMLSDVMGTTVFAVPESSEIVRGVKELLTAMDIFGEEEKDR